MKPKTLALLLAVQSASLGAVNSPVSPFAEALTKELRTAPKLTVSTTSKLVERKLICSNDRVQLAPDGNKIALYRERAPYTYDSRNLVRTFPDQIRLISLVSDQTNTFDSSIVLDPLAWGPDSEEFRVGLAGQVIVSMKIDSEETLGFKLPPGIFGLARVNSNQVLSAEQMRDQYLAMSGFSDYQKATRDRLFLFLVTSLLEQNLRRKRRL